MAWLSSLAWVGNSHPATITKTIVACVLGLCCVHLFWPGQQCLHQHASSLDRLPWSCSGALASEWPPYVTCTQTLVDRDDTLAQAEQTTRQHEEALEERKRQTQELVAQAALQEAQQVSKP